MKFLLFTFPDWLLLSVGALVLIVSALYPFFSLSERGVVVSLGRMPRMGRVPENGCDRNLCGSGVPLEVRLASGAAVLAETSPCGACMERLKPGDPVRILRIGGRCVAQKIPMWMSR